MDKQMILELSHQREEMKRMKQEADYSLDK